MSVQYLKGIAVDEIDAMDDAELLRRLIDRAQLDQSARAAIGDHAAQLVNAIRDDDSLSFLDAFLAEYGLSNDEGVALLSMAEAFLRIPDADTLDHLLREKLTGSDWQSHSGHASSFLVNASTWALMITGRLLSSGQARSLSDTLQSLLRRLGEPVVRRAMTEAMQRMGDHFVIGEDIRQALRRAGQRKHEGSYFSYDMLGEAAHTEADAARYLQSYQEAIAALAGEAGDDLLSNPGISVKLSALHPRFELSQQTVSFKPLLERMILLAEQAAAANIGLSIDAEEMRRQDFGLALFRALARHMQGQSWQGLGAVVQAYSRYTPVLLDELKDLADELDCRFMVRLVKGAYWDTEIKHAQAMGLPNYPVFTRKCDTDVSFLACARQLLQMGPRVYPQFATHNAHSMAAILHMAQQQGHQDWEFQRLYGMGATLHELLRKQAGSRHRIYAPVGQHEDLLAYLVRRLLENGANSSFVHQITDARVPVQTIVADPFLQAQESLSQDRARIVLPSALYGKRLNSRGWELGRAEHLDQLLQARKRWQQHSWETRPLIAESTAEGELQPVINPARPEQITGYVQWASAEEVDAALAIADSCKQQWAEVTRARRSGLLRAAAAELENHYGEILALLCLEAGKTLFDAISEWREAIDFLRFYAESAEQLEGQARGLFLCISPWNFPLAIFTGQIAAALVSGNTVIAKPAEQTPLIAGRMTEIFHRAGIPRQVLQLLPGDGESTGAALCRDPRVNGVCFTGSLNTARQINRSMAAHLSPDACLIAETGGINAMIVDSTALPEQAVEDILQSAFASAGQRCSALRILYLQDDIAEGMLRMLRGAMDSLTITDPWDPACDVGPLIDEVARQAISKASEQYRTVHQLAAPENGFFFAPRLIEVGGIADVQEEIFGPVLFVARYKASELSRVLDDINASGYGLTFAMHSRLVERTERSVARLRIGNVYINRNQIGAVVQSQPFGGEGLSGTGPKAGGPHYLSAFVRQQREDKALFAVVSESTEPGSTSLGEAWSKLDNRQWLQNPERLQLLQKVRLDTKVLEKLPDTGPVIMPGPTGERNRYSLQALNKVLCLGPMPEHALEQAMLALTAGSAVLLACPADAALQDRIAQLKKLGAPVELISCNPDASEVAALDQLEAVCWWWQGRLSRELRQALAGRAGPVVRLIQADSPLVSFFHERHVCNDTTRAGGNIELMGRVAP